MPSGASPRAAVALLAHPRAILKLNSAARASGSSAAALLKEFDISSPVVLHIPHDSLFIPVDEREHLLLNDADLDAELLRMTDRWTLDLFAAASSQIVSAGFSRLLVDVERFDDDSQEPMAKRGMGAIYEHTSDGRRLRGTMPSEDRERLLATYYYPHHERLTAAVDRALADHGRALIVDCHSFSSTPLPHEPDQSADRPDICIGTDAFHTPRSLAESFAVAFRRHGWSLAFDAPFSGSIVPAKHYLKTSSVESIMIEVNRNLYMDESTGAKLSRFDETQSAVAHVLAETSSFIEPSLRRAGWGEQKR